MVEFLLSMISASFCLSLSSHNRQFYTVSLLLLVLNLKLIQAQSFIDKREERQGSHGEVFRSNIIFIEEIENLHDYNRSTHPPNIQARSNDDDKTSNFQPGVSNKGGWNPIIRTSDKTQRQPKQNSLDESEVDSAVSFHGWNNPNLEARTFGKAFGDLNGGPKQKGNTPYGENRPQIQTQTTRRPRPKLVLGNKRPNRPGRVPSKIRVTPIGASFTNSNYGRPQNQRPGIKGARNPSTRGLHRMARRIRFMVDGMMNGLFGLFRKPKRNPGISQLNKRPRKNRRPSPGTGYNSPNSNNVGNNDRPSSHQNIQGGVSSGTYNPFSSSSASHANPSNVLPSKGYSTPTSSGNQLNFQSSTSGTALKSTPTITYGAFQINEAAPASPSSSSTTSNPFIPSSSNGNYVPTFHTVNSNALSNGVSTSNVYTNSPSSSGSHSGPVISSSPLGSHTKYNDYNPPQGKSLPSKTGSSNSQIFSSYTNTLSNSIRTVRDPSNTLGQTRHEPCFNCNKNSGSVTGAAPLSTRYVSPGTISGLGSVRPTREISEKKRDMFELRMAWYHYHQKLKDFEAKYNKEDKDLARFRKEIAEGSASNFPYLIGLRSPQLVEDVDFSESVSTPLSTNLFSTGSQNHVDTSDQPATIHSSYVGSLLQTVIDPYKGTIGPGYSYSSTPIYPKEIQDSIPEDSVKIKATTNPFTRKPRSFPQTRPNVFLPSDNNENKPDKDVPTHRKYGVFDLKTSLANKYSDILTPKTR